jgi:aryl-alcohol dehydrogenase-like predicted oxidoreductase
MSRSRDGRDKPAVLGLGTASLAPGYGLGDHAHAGADAGRLRVLGEALARGIGYIDTSHHYGDADDLVGQAAALVRARGGRLCAKFTAADSLDVVRRTLTRLAVDAVDTVMLHSAHSADLTDARVEALLATVKREGLTVRTGASTYGIRDAEVALARPWMDAIQVEHSILHPAVVAAIAPRKRADQELVVRSVLCKGLLTIRRAHLAGVSPAVIDAVERLDALAAEWGFAGLPELAIRFALDTPGVDVVLVGIATPDELQTALAAAERNPLAATQLAALAAFDCSADPWVHPEQWAAIR